MRGRVVVLSDRTQVPDGRDLADVLAAVAAAGAPTIVLREMDLSDEERARLAACASARGAEVVAAHRHVTGSRGLHLPAVAPSPAPTVRWGRSCHSPADVRAAAVAGAAWVTLSPYSRTGSKPGYGPPLPASAFAGHAVPVFALGGIAPDNAAAARAAGAHGVAVMGAVMRADDPGAVVRALLEAVR